MSTNEMIGLQTSLTLYSLHLSYHVPWQIIIIIIIFTAPHEMQTRSSDENSVCPSVTRVIPDKMEERSVKIFIPYERTFILVF